MLGGVCAHFNSLLISPDLARRFVEFYGKWMDEGAREQARQHGQQPQGYTMAN